MLSEVAIVFQIQHLTLRTRRGGGGGEVIVVVAADLVVDREKISNLFSMHANFGPKLRWGLLKSVLSCRGT